MRSFCEKEVPPVLHDYRDRAGFPFDLVPGLAEVRVAGGTIEGWGCPAMSNVSSGIVAEPEHGSDAVGPETSARRDGDFHVLDGQQSRSGHGSIADRAAVPRYVAGAQRLLVLSGRPTALICTHSGQAVRPAPTRSHF